MTYNENEGKVTVTGTGETETGDYETGSYEDETERTHNTYEERIMGRGGKVGGGKGRNREESQSYSQSRTERSGSEYTEEETTQRSRR